MSFNNLNKQFFNIACPLEVRKILELKTATATTATNDIFIPSDFVSPSTFLRYTISTSVFEVRDLQHIVHTHAGH